MKKINIYTDLALEERERFKRNIEISGVKIDKNYNKELFMTTTDVEIFNENGAKSMGKPIGSYVTMETRLFKEDDLERQTIFAKEIANHMEEMTKNQNIKKILIVGLGNSKATPDSLGPKVAEQIEILPNVYCLAPGGVGSDRYGNFFNSKRHNGSNETGHYYCNRLTCSKKCKKNYNNNTAYGHRDNSRFRNRQS